MNWLVINLAHNEELCGDGFNLDLTLQPISNFLRLGEQVRPFPNNQKVILYLIGNRLKLLGCLLLSCFRCSGCLCCLRCAPVPPPFFSPKSSPFSCPYCDKQHCTAQTQPAERQSLWNNSARQCGCESVCIFYDKRRTGLRGSLRPLYGGTKGSAPWGTGMTFPRQSGSDI